MTDLLHTNIHQALMNYVENGNSFDDMSPDELANDLIQHDEAFEGMNPSLLQLAITQQIAIITNQDKENDHTSENKDSA